MAKRAPRSAPDDDSAAMAATSPRTPRRPPTPPPPTDPPSRTTEGPAKMWGDRLLRAHKDYKAWDDEFDCARLQQYYRGKHWRGLSDEEAKKKYFINLVFATIETQLPALLFSTPKVEVEARVDHEETANSNAAGRATLIEDALQTCVEDPKLKFVKHVTLALRDAYFRFGLVEVGYSADWLDNPNAGKPILKDDNTPMLGSDEQPVLEPAKALKREALFVKRLRPQNLRVFPGRNILEENDWVAYGTWHHVSDVTRNKAYENTQDLRATGRVASDNADDEDDRTRERDAASHSGMVRLWRIWDLRKKVRHVYAEGHPQMLQMHKPFPELPLKALKFFELEDSFYPEPPVFNWIAPQDEINEGREMQKIHRRRAVRRYTVDQGVDAMELEKLETGDDMATIRVPKNTSPGPIMPIEDAPLDGQTWTELAASKDDLALVTGVSGEARGTPEASTATQANIINVKAGLRENSQRTLVAAWLGEIVRHMLLELRAHMQKPLLVKRQVDPFTTQTDPEQKLRKAVGWQQIAKTELDDLDVDIRIDVTSMSPVAMEAQRDQWNVVLTILKDPALRTLLAIPNPLAPTEPPPLLRQTLYLHNIKNDAVVREIWRVLQVVLAGEAKAAAVQGAQASAKQAIGWAFKGEDLSDPLVRAAFVRAEGLQTLAGAIAHTTADAPAPIADSASGDAGPIKPVAEPGQASGQPTDVHA